MGTKLLSEDEFLQLIRDKSGGAAKTKEKENKTPSPEVKKEPGTQSKVKEVTKRETKTSSSPEVKKDPGALSKMKEATKREAKTEAEAAVEAKKKPKTPLEEAIGFQIPKIPVPEAETIVRLLD